MPMDRSLRRGISLGGTLDGGELELDDGWFDAIRDAGLDLVRLPVRWDSVAADRVDRAVEGGLARGLAVVLDVHHFEGTDAAFLALWERIAARYAGADPRLAFELRNEPHDPMTATAWNRLLRDALGVVRARHPERTVIAGPVARNVIAALPTLRLPDDPHLVATVHHYLPFRFTHQGAPWIAGADAWLGTPWGTAADRARIRADLATAAAWARGRRLFLGEFGTRDAAPMAARAAWTALVRAEAERLGMDWAYWDFATEFGAFDVASGSWRAPLLAALRG